MVDDLVRGIKENNDERAMDADIEMLKILRRRSRRSMMAPSASPYSQHVLSNSSTVLHKHNLLDWCGNA